ncbi:hypothetical protein RJ640_026095 [Escallonia rubra]|uniref:CCHC-type domain-containing protein n=1 Tax=Escallonia rubra TaxID=112253 RepID=A0AA88RNW6_9ASTE|nr:hypothetical protein RJ640_026095 [Escallonia rubra]
MASDSFDSDFLESPHTLARYGRLLSLDPDVVARRRLLWANTLIGRIVDTRQFTVQLLQRVVDHFWRLQGRVVVEAVGHLFAFHFAVQSDMELVLKDNPWNIRGTILVLQRWQPSMAIEQVEFFTVDLWLQLHFIPLELFYSDLAGLIGSAFGKLLAMDWNPVRQQRRDFFRVLVRIKLADPLIPGLYVRTNQCESHWIQARYEKVFQVCYRCGVLGHSFATCRIPMHVVRDRLDIASLRYTTADRITMLAHRAKPCFTSALRAFANTSWNRTTRFNIIDDGDAFELVYGTDRGSSVDSDNDLIVQIHGLNVNLENESAGDSSFSDQYFSTESVGSLSSGSVDSFDSPMELAGVAAAAVTGEGAAGTGDSAMAVADVAPSHSVHDGGTTSTDTSAAAAASVGPLVQSVNSAVHVCQPPLTADKFAFPSVEASVDKFAHLGFSQLGRDFMSGLRGVHFGPVLSIGKQACQQLLTLITSPANSEMGRTTEQDNLLLACADLGLEINQYGSYLEDFQPGPCNFPPGIHDHEASTSKTAHLPATPPSPGNFSPSFNLRAPDYSSDSSDDAVTHTAVPPLMESAMALLRIEWLHTTIATLKDCNSLSPSSDNSSTKRKRALIFSDILESTAKKLKCQDNGHFTGHPGGTHTVRSDSASTNSGDSRKRDREEALELIRPEHALKRARSSDSVASSVLSISGGGRLLPDLHQMIRRILAPDDIKSWVNLHSDFQSIKGYVAEKCAKIVHTSSFSYELVNNDYIYRQHLQIYEYSINLGIIARHGTEHEGNLLLLPSGHQVDHSLVIVKGANIPIFCRG